ncbi:uncharacterized protein K441DRAFT_567191 [Cenococcum geophilum 1.58]|uniref:uncharacterized protein n=1 Tax=Cenococcum geophilum 1.58 TaxID=794803 RepID=UPI00358ED04D|nr:hypothetical protein K441DRAFT_567191 [Cenococcum geophilum 1.58]
MSPAPSLPSNMTEPNTSTSLWARFEQLAAVDAARNELITEVLHRYDYLSEQHKKECEDHDREREYNRTVQRQKKELENKMRQMQLFMERDPFVIVLIDADGMIFQDELLKAAETGGKKAAAHLQTLLSEYIQIYMPSIPSDVKIVARIYANVKGLANICVRAGIVDNITQVEDFVRGFTRGRTLFDFVDVGPGKDRADEKLIETFKLYIHDVRCRHIFFGCSHDNGYARVLEELSTEQLYLDRITLLEGVPFEKELSALPFNTKKFETIFRSSKINVFDVPNGFPPPFPPPLRGMAQLGLGAPQNTTQQQTPTPSVSTVAPVEKFPTLQAAQQSTWATKAAAPPPPGQSPSPTYEALSRDDNPATISRNRAGQRVDPPVRNYDKEEVNRVKNIKMCNVHFLRGECPFGDNCTHVHRYNPTPTEVATLRLVARMAPCQNGSACEDVKCIYGHRCPAPEAKPGVKGGKNCIFGDKCKFPVELHALDTNVVKTTVIRG